MGHGFTQESFPCTLQNLVGYEVQGFLDNVKVLQGARHSLFRLPAHPVALALAGAHPYPAPHVISWPTKPWKGA